MIPWKLTLHSLRLFIIVLLAFFDMLSLYPQSVLQGFCGDRRRGSAAVCDPNPPRPFARYRLSRLWLTLAVMFFFFFFFREGANREKLTVKKLIDNEMFFFFTVYVPYKPWKIGVNREKIGTKPWKNRHQKSTIFSPLVFHRLRLLDFFFRRVHAKGLRGSYSAKGRVSAF